MKESFYGSRMQPYAFLQRHHEAMRNQVTTAAHHKDGNTNEDDTNSKPPQTNLSRSKLSGSYSDIPYVSNKEMYKEMQARRSGGERMTDFSALGASFWGKKYSSCESLQGWNHMRERALEKA